MAVRNIYESQRDLLIVQLYKRGTTAVASRAYTYDTLGRPVTRSTSKDDSTVNDSFGYNSRSELNIATVNNEAYAYDYDNIGNRETAQEAAESATSYESNQLNQYTAIGDFEPSYDDAGNQTRVNTSTGIWSVQYNAENRPVRFTSADGATIIECSYDTVGRRATKKVTVNGNVTLHQRFLYRGYLQIACCDLTRAAHPALWFITWDPTQPIATRPLAIRKDGTWFAYGWDLTKNICEVFGPAGYIRTAYTYSPYGSVTATGDVTQPIQWSSEYNDTELGQVYYNFRHYSPVEGRWLGRDRMRTMSDLNWYAYSINNAINHYDLLGMKYRPVVPPRSRSPKFPYRNQSKKLPDYNVDKNKKIKNETWEEIIERLGNSSESIWETFLNFVFNKNEIREKSNSLAARVAIARIYKQAGTKCSEVKKEYEKLNGTSSCKKGCCILTFIYERSEWDHGPQILHHVDYKYVEKPCNKEMPGTPQILPKGWGIELRYHNM